ncbi:MAG: hypothetical protein JWO41_844 [Candidatus Saccharibacteria bacterium]|nr:hypothetical protein [Candidatus Saccharibacteria bacterium]
MKLFKGKPVEPTRRQRYEREQGSAANYSYYNRRSQTSDNTGRDTAREALRKAARKHGSFWLQRFGLLFLLVAAVACLISSASLSPHAKIIALKGADGAALLQDPSVYQAAADKLLDGSILNRTKITVNTDHLAQALAKQFPELGGATVTLPLLAHRPIVYLQPVQPVLIMSTPNGSFVIDSTGKALLPSTSLIAAQRDALPAVIDQSGFKVEANKLVLPSSTVAFVQVVLTQLKAHSFTAASLTLPAASQELDVKLADQPFFVKFNLADAASARTQAGTFIAAFGRLQQQGISPGQYIDVRLVGRAYYK